MFLNCHPKFCRDGNKASLAVGTMTDPDLQMQHHAVSGLMNYPSNSGNQHMKRSGKKEMSAMIFFLLVAFIQYCPHLQSTHFSLLIPNMHAIRMINVSHKKIFSCHLQVK